MPLPTPLRLLVSIARLVGLVLQSSLRVLAWLLRTRIGRGVLLGLLVYSGVQSCRAPVLRVGTFNLRELGPQTDLARLRAILAEVDPDVLAVQEIPRVDTLRRLAAELSAATRRRYEVALSACGGRRALHVGFLFDAEKVRLDEVREFPELRDDGKGSCSSGARAGLLGVFSARAGLRRVRTHLLTVHFPAGAEFGQAQERQAQWARALRIVARLRQDGEARVLLLGDVNSTGYRDDTYGERSAIHRQVEQAGLDVPTRALGCTEYFRPRGAASLQPSHLDHIVATPALRAGAATLHGYCAALRCQPATRVPRDYEAVSDHCPVTVDLR